MTDVFGALLRVHLACAFGATVVFWAAASARKGLPFHRAAGRWFSRLIYSAAVTGGIMSVCGLAWPDVVHPPDASVPADTALVAAAVARQTMWFVLYVLLIIVAPVQHGLAVVAAGPSPSRIRSILHATLNIAAIIGTVLIFGASLVWRQWMFLIVMPIGFIVGSRNLQYAGRPSAAPDEWQREHLTSLITAGITLHTAFFVFGTSRSLGLALQGWTSLLPWTVPAVVGLPLIIWIRSRWRGSEVFSTDPARR